MARKAHCPISFSRRHRYSNTGARVIRAWAVTIFLILTAALPTEARPVNPISLHPDSPHYFRFHERPTVLITSAEHYGAVLNRDFQAAPYLGELQARGFNLTRVFSGAYAEDPTSISIENNTLAPAAGRF